MKMDIIIPTYGRSKGVVVQTLDSIIKCQDFNLINKIIVIDQNNPKLDIGNYSDKLDYILMDQPSVTRAKNLGIKSSNADYLIFFDDDVIVRDGTFTAFKETYESSNACFIGGQEIILSEEARKRDASLVVRFKKFIRERIIGNDPKRVAKVSKNGFFFCDFSKEVNSPVQIDTVRGCNFSVKKECFDKVGGFDTNYSGTSLREEADLILRIRQECGEGVYNSNASVLHLRQFGGCGNLDMSLVSLNSKLKNETYFQRKFFPQTNPVLFMLRLLPLAAEHFTSTNALSIVVMMKYVYSFLTQKESEVMDKNNF